MIKIANEDIYDSLPRYTNIWNAQHTKESMVFKAMTYVCNDFWVSELIEILWDNFGVKLSRSSAGKAMSALYSEGYVTRRMVKGKYRYTKTDLYHNKVMS